MSDYDCDTCDKVTKLMRGCESEETSVNAFVIKGESLWRCPIAVFNEMNRQDRDLVNEIMIAYYYSEKGILPKAGGWKDQDRFIIECIPLVSRWVNAETNRRVKQSSK